MTKVINDLIGDIEKYDQEIIELNSTIAEKLKDLLDNRAIAQTLLDTEIVSQVKDKFGLLDYGCGTVNFETDNFKIKTTVSKKIKWDEAMLKDISKQIIAAGKDPEVYIKCKLSVAESVFTSFPDAIKQTFAPARSVEPSAPKFKIEGK